MDNLSIPIPMEVAGGCNNEGFELEVINKRNNIEISDIKINYVEISDINKRNNIEISNTGQGVGLGPGNL